MTVRSPVLYLSEMLASMEKIERYIAGVTYEEFIGREQLIDAVERNIEKIGEAAAGVPVEIRAGQDNHENTRPWHRKREGRDPVIFPQTILAPA